ncbi:hypothetical protein JL720_5217 [Aureococcus anophagefferens]|nr:hypothetical protein JL720_5217 [Aureococcus anophagefferens]
MQGSAPAPIDTTPQSARLRKLRATVENALRNEMATTAVWYADKLVTLSRGNVEDVLLLARSFYASGDHARAARALETRKAYGSARQPAAQFERGVTAASAAPELRARLLAARCLAKCGRHADCVATLEPELSAVEAFDSGELAGPPAPPAEGAGDVDDDDGGIDLAAAPCTVAGVAYEALETGARRGLARRALRLDATCSEALTFLVERRLLSAVEEKRLLGELAALTGDDAWIAAVLCARAEHSYYQHDCRGAHALARRVYGADPYDFACVPVYLASMVELGLKHELFYCAHELVRAYPKHAASWFAVGCYYLLVGKNDAAQRYFHKSAKLAPRFAPAWIGFGNAFAAQDESEQAMAAYRSASRLFQGSHVPLMFIGMEYLRTNNLPLAKHFLRGARKLCGSDPMVLNELGVVELRQGLYADAEQTFSDVFVLFERLPDRSPLKSACESSVFNLAQTYRKMKRFDDAARYFELALALKPGDAAIRGALGVTLHALGGAHVHKAVECYHTALAMRPDDTFCSEMLSRALRDVAEMGELFPEDPGKEKAHVAERALFYSALKLDDADDDGAMEEEKDN